MSLRDALFNAGVVDKKKVKKVNRDLKKKRKKKQAHREKKKVLEAREQQQRDADRQARHEARLTARQESRAEAETRGRALRTRHIVQAHTVNYRMGPVRFHHVDGEGRLALKLRLPWSIARGLKEGRYAVARLERPYLEDAYVIIDRDAALRVPEALVFFNESPPEDLPENGLLEECLS